MISKMIETLYRSNYILVALTNYVPSSKTGFSLKAFQRQNLENKNQTREKSI